MIIKMIDIANLTPRNRATWLVRFIDGSQGDCFDVPFPILGHEETPVSWVADQFRKSAALTESGRDEMEESVDHLLATRCNLESTQDRIHVIGCLLEIVGKCGITRVADMLRIWIASDIFPSETYRVMGRKETIRCTTWSLMINWKKHGELRNELIRDLGRSECQSTQLCMGGLVSLDARDVVERIPDMLSWRKEYWQEHVRSLVQQVGVNSVLHPSFRDAWQKCFSRIIYDPSRGLFIQQPRTEGELQGALVQVLNEVGIDIEMHSKSEDGDSVDNEDFKDDWLLLQSVEEVGISLRIALGEAKKLASNWISTFTRDHLARLSHDNDWFQNGTFN